MYRPKQPYVPTSEIIYLSTERSALEQYATWVDWVIPVGGFGFRLNQSGVRWCGNREHDISHDLWQGLEVGFYHNTSGRLKYVACLKYRLDICDRKFLEHVAFNDVLSEKQIAGNKLNPCPVLNYPTSFDRERKIEWFQTLNNLENQHAPAQ